MKNYILPVMLSLLTVFSACSDKIDIAAPYKDVMVVYGVLNMYDTAHYIRIQKGFMDQNKSAVTMAKEYDSSFFADLNVRLLELNPDNGNLIATLPLTKVDLNQEGYTKETEGDFFTTPNYAYKVQFPGLTYQFNPYHNYTLIIENNKTGKIDSSQTFRFVNGDSSQRNDAFFITKFLNAQLPLTFPRTTQSSFTFDLTGNIPLNAKMIEGHLIFNYIDSNVVSGTSTRKSIDYLFATDVAADKTIGAQFQLKVENSLIYRFLYDEMGPAPANVQRYLDSCDLRILAGSDELYTYRQVYLGQKGGLTGDQIQPNYTTMKGENVLGVIGTRAERFYHNAGIDGITMDSILKNQFLQPLSIKGRTSN